MDCLSITEQQHFEMAVILKDQRRNTTLEDEDQCENISSDDGATNSLQTSNDGKDYFSTLPEEIILMIFKFLPPKDIIKPVCKRWYDISFNSILWKKVSLKYEFISIDFLKIILQRGTKILCCEKCKFDVPKDWSDFGLHRFDSLQTLSLEHTVIKGKVMENLLSLTRHLKVLNLKGHGHERMNCDSFRTILKLKHLEELSLSAMFVDILDISKNCEKQIAKLKKLKHLELQSCLIVPSKEPSERTNSFCSLRFLILKHCRFFQQKTMRNLFMCCSQLTHLSLLNISIDLLGKDIGHILEMENLEHLEISCNTFQTTGLTPIYHNKKLHNLRYLEISCQDKSKVAEFLGLCENLMELYLINVLMDIVPSPIAQMKELHTLRIKSSENITSSQIQSVLRGCPKLREHNLSEYM